MNDAAWEAFVSLSTQAMDDTERTLNSVFESYESRIAALEEENEMLRRELREYRMTTLADLVERVGV